MTYQEWADKLEAIGSYLQSVFPQYHIEKIEDSLRSQLFRKHMFRLEDHNGEIEQFFSLDYDYLDRNTADQIIESFKKGNLEKILEESGRKEVIMTDDGVRVIPRKN